MESYPVPSGPRQRPGTCRSRPLVAASIPWTGAARQRRLWIAVSVFLAATLVAPADREAKPPEQVDQALRQIEVAFRTAESRRLGPVLPRDSKVLVALDSFSQPEGYYAADQVILLFQEIFEAARVIHFHLDRKRLGSADAVVLYVPARWAVRTEESGIREARLQFTIRREDDAYYIRSIKELH